MYPELQEEHLDTEKSIQVLEVLRRSSPGLNITGGEPTLRHDIEELLEHATRLRFCPVTLNTNGFFIDRHLPILKHIDYLVVSLDSLDNTLADGLLNLNRQGQTARVRRNIELAVDYRRKHELKFDFVINSVIFPETIDDAWDVFEYCLANDFYWSPMPHIIGKYPSPGLVDNPRWRQLIDEVIRAKQSGARICGNTEALTTIRDFKRFECYPTTHPVVYPDGGIHFPCSPLNLLAGNLLELGGCDEAMRAGVQKHGPVPTCDSRCHIGCHTEISTAISHPKHGLVELLNYILGSPTRSVVLRRPPERRSLKLPSFKEFRALPSAPPDTIRHWRRKGLIDNDWSSALRIKDGGKLIQITPTRNRSLQSV
jgi:organic radical activating enzyme